MKKFTPKQAIVAWGLLIPMILMSVTSCDVEPRSPAEECLSDQRHEVRMHGYKLKMIMKNPDSFKRISMTKLSDTQWEIVYQATNGYGAMIRSRDVVTVPTCKGKKS